MSDRVVASSVRLFLSSVTAEFGSYRAVLQRAFRRPNLEAKVQEDFNASGGELLLKLDDYIKACDAVVHIVGDRTGSIAPKQSIDALLQRYPDLATRCPALAPGLDPVTPRFSYTQWEAYLALMHGRTLFIAAPAASGAHRDTTDAAPADQAASQAAHLTRLQQGFNRYPEITFANSGALAIELYRSSLLENLYKAGRLQRPKIDVSRMPTTYAKRLFGRDTEMADLDKAWLSEGDAKTNVVVLDAMGGTGKTALVNHFVHDFKAPHWGGAEAIYVWSFYSQGTDDKRQASADEFFKKALEFFGHTGDLPNSPHEKGLRLAELIKTRRALVILDGLEPLQYGPSRRAGGSGDAGLTGGLKDQGLRALVRQLANDNPGLMVVTTRLKVPDLAGFPTPQVINERLRPIPTTDGIELIRTIGVKGKYEEMKALVEELHGHAIALTQVATWLVNFRDGDVRCKDELPSLVDLGGDNERHPFRVMLAYETQFKRQIAEQAGKGQKPVDIAAAKQLSLLFMMGLFDRPMERGDREALLKPPAIPGLTDGLIGLTPGQLDYAVQSLRDLGLMLPKDADAPDDLDAHPLVREYFGARLEKAQLEAWKAAQSRLYDYYRFKGLPEPFQDPVAYGVLALCVTFPEVKKRIRAVTQEGQWPDGWLPVLPPSLIEADWAKIRAASILIDTNEWNSAAKNFLPESADAMAPLFIAIAHASAAGQQRQALREVYLPRISRGNEGYSTEKLGLHGMALGALAHFFVEPFQLASEHLSHGERVLIFANVGYLLRALGRLDEAIAPIRMSIVEAVAQNQFAPAGDSSENLSELLLALGDVSGATSAAIDCITFQDKTDRRFDQMTARTTYANILFQSGKWKEAQSRWLCSALMLGHRQPTA